MSSRCICLDWFECRQRTGRTTALNDMLTCRPVSKRFKFPADNYVNLRELIVRSSLNDSLRLDLIYVTGAPVSSREALNYKNLLGAKIRAKFCQNPFFQ